MNIVSLIDNLTEKVLEGVSSVKLDEKLSGEIVVRIILSQGGIRGSRISLENIKIN
jgi:hypothetical protein